VCPLAAEVGQVPVCVCVCVWHVMKQHSSWPPHARALVHR
jgi:hypothetical protein